MRRRLATGLRSSLCGWFVAWLCSVPFQVPELARNAEPASMAGNLAEGLALWAAFTFTVCLAVWLVIVLPGSLLLPPELVRRGRWAILLAGAVFGVYEVGDRLGTWTGLREDSPLNPFDSVLFWMYSLFGVAYTFVTVMRYVRAMRGQ